jgi:hypothetical protein
MLEAVQIALQCRGLESQILEDAYCGRGATSYDNARYGLMYTTSRAHGIAVLAVTGDDIFSGLLNDVLFHTS